MNLITLSKCLTAEDQRPQRNFSEVSTWPAKWTQLLLPISVISVDQWYGFSHMEKKIFWLLFTVLGVVMGLVLPSLWWNLALTLPLLVLCWWVVYRSGWFS